MDAVNSRLAAKLGVRQVEAHIRADRAAEAADAIVRHEWERIKAFLRRACKNRVSNWHMEQEARATIRFLFFQTGREVADALRRTITWGHRSAVAALIATVPGRLLAWAARERAIREGRDGHEVDFDRDLDGSGCGVDQCRTGVDVFLSSRLPSLEIQGKDTEGTGPVARRPDGIHEARRGGLGASAQLLEAAPTVSDILFPRFSDDLINRIIFGSGWADRLRAGTSLGAPDLLASLLAGGLAAGKTPREIAKDLLPHVNGVRSTARRIARTETMRVADRAQMECHKQLGDLVIGYQIHATLDQHTRPWHASRSGTIYFLRPKPGQKGPDQMPNPPDEPKDPRERPAKAPAIAWNCRCYRSPVLKEPKNAEAIPRAVTPDPLTYREWFAQTDDRRRRAVVGARRLAFVRGSTQSNEPGWEHFLDPETGDLMPLAALKAETPTQRLERVAVVQQDLAKRKALLAATSQVGFVPGE